MKHAFTFLAILFCTITFSQQKLIAVKGPVTDAVATTLEEAIEIAQHFDKIYLPGGTFTLNDSLQKPVHIIGTGYNHTLPRATQITTFTSQINIGSQANGTIIEGVRVNNTVNLIAQSCIVKRSHVNELNSYSQTNRAINCYIHNLGHSVGVPGPVNYSTGCNLIVHNSIINHLRMNGAVVHNSLIILFDSYYTTNGGINSGYIFDSLYLRTISNWFGNCNSGYIVVTNSLCANNDIGVFAGYFEAYNDGLFDYNANLSLSPFCPIQGIGIYHGEYPWKDGGQPINPHIEENNSFLDVQNEQFKLRVKVIPQTN